MELKVLIIKTYLNFKYLVQRYILLFVNIMIVFKNKYLIVSTTKSKHHLIITKIFVHLQPTKRKIVEYLYHSEWNEINQ